MFDLHKVKSEESTLDILLSGRSISRIGEGEFRLAGGTPIKSQVYDPCLSRELLKAVSEKSKAYICLPRLWPTMPNYHFWLQFNKAFHAKNCKLAEYGSAFISRPDMANNIDTLEYWDKVRSIWKNQSVTLVSHGLKVLKMPDAQSVNLIRTAPVGAYQDIDKIEEEIGKPSGPIILCLGATATVLAVRLANKGLWALDLGHLGHFLPHAGAFSLDKISLISGKYIKQNKALHRAPEGFGGSGKKSAETVLEFAQSIDAARILDYGCGQGTLRNKLLELGWKRDVLEYDPAIDGKDTLPKPAELVTCTDVLEHVEPDKLDAVLQHIYTLTKQAAYFLVATRPAQKFLSDGRNAHLILKDAKWWRQKIQSVGFGITREESKLDHDVKFWCIKND